jgi:DNA primase
MSNLRRRFKWLSEQFEVLAGQMETAGEPEQRKELLRRMRVIIAEIDELVLREDLQPDLKEKARIFTLKAELNTSD